MLDAHRLHHCPRHFPSHTTSSQKGQATVPQDRHWLETKVPSLDLQRIWYRPWQVEHASFC